VKKTVASKIRSLYDFFCRFGWGFLKMLKSIGFGVVLFVLIMLNPQAVRAADDTEFKNSGEVRLRYFNDLNSTGREASGQQADTQARFKFNVAAEGRSCRLFSGFFTAQSLERRIRSTESFPT
jgi:hypothetical protein